MVSEIVCYLLRLALQPATLGDRRQADAELSFSSDQSHKDCLWQSPSRETHECEDGQAVIRDCF